MHRVGGLAAVGRWCLQDGVTRNACARRKLSTGPALSSSARLAIGVASVGAAGAGAAYAFGAIDLPWRSKESAAQTLGPIVANIPMVSATSIAADDRPISESRLKKKKKPKKSEEVVSDAPAESIADQPPSVESIPEDFTAVPPSPAVSAAAEAAAPLPLEDDGPVAVVEAWAEAVAEVSEAELSEEPAPQAAVEPASTEYLLEPDVVGKIRDLDLEAEAENKILASILGEAMEESTKAVSSAVVSLVDAADLVKNYTILLKKALDDSNPDKKGAWNQAVGMSLDKERLLSSATEAYGNAKNALVIALQAVEGGRQNPRTRDNTELIRVEEQIYRLRGELDDRFLALEKSQSDSRIMKAFTDLVEQGKQQFNAELKALMPDIKLNESGSKLSEAELNLLIAYAHRWIMQLQRQLAEYQLLEEQHLTDALDKQKAEDESMAASRLREALAEQQGVLTLEKERQVSEVRKKAEEDLLSQLKRQAAAHSQHLREVLSVQEEDYNHRLKTILGEGIAVERRKLENLVRDAFNQLKGIETAIDARAGAELAARTRQDLWVAVAALKAAVGNQHRIPLGDRVAAVSAAAGEDEVISTLLSAIPEEARAGGIYSNADLKTRFEKVKEICKKVSLITEEGGLFQTFLSYAKYLMTVESVLVQPAEELKPETDSMMKLVCHAQWYVEHDDLESALRCMNQLRGEPRRTAFDWISEARAALETRQAIDALHSWVSALNLGQFPPELKS